MNITSIAPRLWGRRPGKTLAFLAMALFLGLAWTTTSHASTAAYTTIRNEVTVQYADAGGNPQADLSADVEFSVALVAATPILNAPGDQEIDSSATATYAYTLTATANGPDSYTLSAGPLVESAGINGSAVVINGGTLTVNLGATTAAEAIIVNAGANTTIVVPSDLASDGAVNGIAAGDIVVIGVNEFTVFDIVDNGGVGTSEIIVAPNTTTPSIAVGEIIGERGSFSIVVTPGTVTDATADQTIEVTLFAQDAGTIAASTNDVTVTTVTGLTLTVTKYVRNDTTPNAGIGAFDLYGDGTFIYYTGGVQGAPGETMEYLVRIENAAGGSMATGLIIIDQVPEFTTYVSGSMALAVDPTVPGNFASLNDNDSGTDAGEYDGSDPATIYIYAGSNGDDGGAGYGNGSGGELPGGSTTYGRFQVIINN